MAKKELISGLNREGKEFFAIFEKKVTHRDIERAYEDNPNANADGTIDSYVEHMGHFIGVFAEYVDSREEADEMFKVKCPTIVAEDETRIILKPMKVEIPVYN